MCFPVAPQYSNSVPDPTGPTFLTYTPNGKRLITAGSNNAIRVYTTGSDGEPTNIDDCQENNTAIAATVSTIPVSPHPPNLLKSRTTFSSPAPKMAWCACTRWKHAHMKSSSHVTRCQLGISRSRQMESGRPLQASKELYSSKNARN